MAKMKKLVRNLSPRKGENIKDGSWNTLGTKLVHNVLWHGYILDPRREKVL